MALVNITVIYGSGYALRIQLIETVYTQECYHCILHGLGNRLNVNMLDGSQPHLTRVASACILSRLSRM